MESEPILTSTELHEGLATFDIRSIELRKAAKKQLQELLTRFSGYEFVSLVEKQQIASHIRQTMRSLQLCIACPKCGSPAMIKAAKAGNAKQGVFQFTHSSGGARRTHAGSTAFPHNLQVVDADVDRREKHWREQKG